jgi:hypothetical protein
MIDHESAFTRLVLTLKFTAVAMTIAKLMLVPFRFQAAQHQGNINKLLNCLSTNTKIHSRNT